VVADVAVAADVAVVVAAAVVEYYSDVAEHGAADFAETVDSGAAAAAAAVDFDYYYYYRVAAMDWCGPTHPLAVYNKEKD
jgi:hypothetical protein